MKWIPLFTLAALCIGFAGGGCSHKSRDSRESENCRWRLYRKCLCWRHDRGRGSGCHQCVAQSVDDAVLTLNANGKSVEVSAQELGITFQNTNAVQEALAVGRNGNLIKRYKDKKDLEHGSKVFELPLGLNETAQGKY